MKLIVGMVKEKSCNLSEKWVDLSRGTSWASSEEHLPNTYKKVLSWPHFDDEPRVEEKDQVKDQKSCIFVVVACLKIPSNNYGHRPKRDNNILYMGVW